MYIDNGFAVIQSKSPRNAAKALHKTYKWGFKT